MSVHNVSQKNMGECLEFLDRYEDSTQFLINNLKEHGPRLTAHHNSGNYKMIVQNDVIRAVFCLSRRGSLLVQSMDDHAELILNSCAEEPIELKSFVGDWNSIQPVLETFKKTNPNYKPTFESKEILYSYILDPNDTKLKHDSRVRFLEERDFSQWIVFDNEYRAELSLPNDLSSQQKRSDYLTHIADRVWWGLFDNDTLISQARLNSKGETVGQVGGVYTPPKLRQKGFAKVTMFHMLKDCRDVHLHNKSILFTGESDMPAQKLYESMGYKRIGAFALVLS